MKPLTEQSVNLRVKTVAVILIAITGFIFGVAVVWANTVGRIEDLESTSQAIEKTRFTDKDGELLEQMVENNQKRIESTEQKIENIADKLDNKFEKVFIELSRINS